MTRQEASKEAARKGCFFQCVRFIDPITLQYDWDVRQIPNRVGEDYANYRMEESKSSQATSQAKSLA